MELKSILCTLPIEMGEQPVDGLASLTLETLDQLNQRDLSRPILDERMDRGKNDLCIQLPGGDGTNEGRNELFSVFPRQRFRPG